MINPSHFREIIKEELKGYIDNQSVINQQIQGGSEQGPSSSYMGIYANDLANSLRNPDGYYYFVNGYSSYGGMDRVGP